MSNEPDKIYLQIGEVDSDIDFNELAGVTWSEDNIYATDIKYHHDRKYQKAIEALEGVLAGVARLGPGYLEFEFYIKAKQALKELAEAEQVGEVQE